WRRSWVRIPSSALRDGPPRRAVFVPAQRASDAAGAVELLVDELVGALVVLAPDGADRPSVERAERPHRLLEQRLQPGVLHLVLPADLAGDELGVVHDLHRMRPELAGQLEAQ